MPRPSRPDAVSAWYGLWLLVFAVDASLAGRGRDHQLGAAALGVLFATLVVTEVLATRRSSRD